MNGPIIGIAGMILCLLALLLFAFTVYLYRNNTKEMNCIETMLLQAIEGQFQASSYDESRLSRMESRFARFLSGSALSQNQIQLERDKIKELIGDTSHQTKTPLANILLYTQLLLETDLNAEQKELVDQAGFYGEKLNWLIQSLVMMSRLENQLIQVRPVEQKVFSMLEEVAEAYGPRAGQKNIRLLLKRSKEEAETAVWADRKWTVEALSNLVDNAVKYTPECGQVTISVKKYQMFLRIHVEDTGPGIQIEEHSKIFQRFYRGAEVTAAEGVGVGLYLARQIISEEGGYIKVTSTPGKGAVFSIFLRIFE